jgi:hypothetical protein
MLQRLLHPSNGCASQRQQAQALPFIRGYNYSEVHVLLTALDILRPDNKCQDNI